MAAANTGQSGTSLRTRQWSVAVMSTLAFTVCFAIWMMFAVIGIPIKKMLDLNATQFGLLSRDPGTDRLSDPRAAGAGADATGGNPAARATHRRRLARAAAARVPRESEPLVALLGAALTAAGVETHPDAGGVAARLLRAPRAVLAVVVNETPDAARRRLSVEGRVVEIPVESLRARLALFERGTGKLLVATPGAPIQD